MADLFIKCLGPTKPPYGTPERAEWEAAWDANPRPCDTCGRTHKSGADFGELVPFETEG